MYIYNSGRTQKVKFINISTLVHFMLYKLLFRWIALQLCNINKKSEKL